MLSQLPASAPMHNRCRPQPRAIHSFVQLLVEEVEGAQDEEGRHTEDQHAEHTSTVIGTAREGMGWGWESPDV